VTDTSYPRPQLRRSNYELLDGVAGFAFDDSDVGLSEGWHVRADVFDREIILPFSPESPASGIADTGFHSVVWYRLKIESKAAVGERVILHFGAVDRIADVWVDGHHVGHHEGGQTAFAFDVTTSLTNGVVIVRAQDDPLDTVAPRGKQDWHEEPHSIWYHRTTGIWRSVWAEVVPELHITELAWTPDVAGANVNLEIALTARPSVTMSVTVVLAGLSRVTVDTDSDRVVIDVPIARLRNGQAIEELLWTPEHPHLIEATVLLSTGDSVDSYFGLRTVSIAHGQLMLNDRPFPLRSVLQQGYWPTSHFTAPSVEHMRSEVELIKRLGFNSIRIHQKVEDPRYLYFCDSLGLTVWAEAAAAYEFSARAIELFTTDWTRIVRAQISHPSIITWVPFNESWGIQHISHVPAQRAYSIALTQLTRAIDPSRPVISNDGWEHTDSDIVTIHDYENSSEVLRDRYGSPESVREVLSTFSGPGRRMGAPGTTLGATPVMLTEFGGVRLGGSQQDWGYSTAATPDELQRRLEELFAVVHASPVLSGFCYTQLADTGQEVNGLCDENRVPKLPEHIIRAIVAG